MIYVLNFVRQKQNKTKKVIDYLLLWNSFLFSFRKRNVCLNLLIKKRVTIIYDGEKMKVS